MTKPIIIKVKRNVRKFKVRPSYYCIIYGAVTVRALMTTVTTVNRKDVSYKDLLYKKNMISMSVYRQKIIFEFTARTQHLS